MTTYIRYTTFPATKGFQFSEVSWVTLSPAGDQLYILQRGVPAVTIWDLAGNLLDSWDTQELGYPHSLSFQELYDGIYRIWITDMAPPLTAGDYCGHCLKQFDMAGNYLGSIGTCGEDTAGSGLNPVQFGKVTDIAFDSNGFLWVTDGDIDGVNNRVLQINPWTQEVVQVWSAPNNSSGNGPREFNLPHSLDIDEFDRIWIADALNSRIQIVTTDGIVLQELACFGENGVYGLCVRKNSSTGLHQLFVSTSPASSPTGGIIKIFEVATVGLPVPGECMSEYEWNISLPQGTSEAMLHAIEATNSGNQIFLATLGGDLPPQSWTKVSLP